MLRLICGIVLVTFAMADTLLQQEKRAECIDFYGGCGTFKHMCDNKYVSKGCEATCGKCKVKPITVPPEGLKECPQDGGDRYLTCANKTSMGWCLTDPFVRKNCRASCGFCIARPTPAPVATVIEVGSSECAAPHNAMRSRHIDTPNLTWDNDLAKASLEWAIYLANLNSISKSRKLRYSDTWDGENLYAGTSSGGVKTCADAVQSWYDEIKDYNWKDPRYTVKTRHFTQMVWKKTSKVGCGIAKIKQGDASTVFVVCHYWKRGNMMGEMVNNVKPLKQ